MRSKRSCGMPSGIVASMPTFAPVGTTPAACGRLGSSGFARAFRMMITSRSPCTRVAIAHSTSIGSNTSMSSSTTTTCLRSITESAASSAFLPSPGCFLIEMTACQNAQPPSVTLMSFTCTPAVLQRRADRGVARRRREPGVLPRHVQGVVDRVLAHRDRLDAHQRVPVQPAHQPRELAEAAFRLGPAGRQDLGLRARFRRRRCRAGRSSRTARARPARRAGRRRSPSRRRRAARESRSP